MKDKVKSIAENLVAKGRGILAADWSLGTSKKHFDRVGIKHTEENRRLYHQMLFTTPELEKYISGVIFFDETIRQKTDDGKPFPQLLSERGIIPGIKVDKGAKETSEFPGEKVTEGLDGLPGRLEEYVDLGAKFTKWRVVITIGDGIPTKKNIDLNSERMARFAALSQEAGLAPIVEPEVLMDGSHDIERDEEVTRETLKSVFSALERHKIFIEGTILKTNYVHPGKDGRQEVNFEEIAKATLRTLKRVVPHNLPGVVFLSGGDSPQESTKHLAYLNKLGDQPWDLSFSYARALQYPAIEIWKGKAENISKAQEALLNRAKLNSAARSGELPKDLQ